MSIVEKNIIDGIGITRDKKGIVLMISDHLKWKEEYKHLLMLQEKINAYLTFWEEKQYMEIYKDDKFEYGIIEIYFKYNATEKCKQFIGVVNEQIIKLNLEIRIC